MTESFFVLVCWAKRSPDHHLDNLLDTYHSDQVGYKSIFRRDQFQGFLRGSFRSVSCSCDYFGNCSSTHLLLPTCSVFQGYYHPTYLETQSFAEERHQVSKIAKQLSRTNGFYSRVFATGNHCRFYLNELGSRSLTS